MNTRLFWVSGTAIAAVAVAGTFANAAEQPKPAAYTDGPQIPAPKPPVQSVSPDLASKFSLFREANGKLEAARADKVGKSIPAQFGANGALAREVHLAEIDETVVLAPSDGGGVCLWVPMSGGESGSSCATYADAVAGRLYVQVVTPGAKQSTLVALVPDGATAASVNAAGERVKLDVESNIAVTTDFKIRDIEVGEASHDVTPPEGD